MGSEEERELEDRRGEDALASKGRWLSVGKENSMLQWFARRLKEAHRDQRGLTLIELLVIDHCGFINQSELRFRARLTDGGTHRLELVRA